MSLLVQIGSLKAISFDQGLVAKVSALDTFFRTRFVQRPLTNMLGLRKGLIEAPLDQSLGHELFRAFY